MLQSAVRLDQRIAIYWPKSYLLLLFIIIVEAGVVPTKTDWNAMNLTRWYRERKKERRVTEEEKEERTNPKFCQWCRSFICRFELEIVLTWLTCRHPYSHFTVGQLNQNDKTALSQCVPSRCLWYQRVSQTFALKIAAFRVSDWLRLATAWALWMGPYICLHFPLTTEKIAPKLLRLFDLNLLPVGCDVSAYVFFINHTLSVYYCVEHRPTFQIIKNWWLMY